MRLYARDNTHALRSSEWIQLDASWSCSHSCLKTSADIFLQTCHPVLPWGPCCPLKWTQKAVRLEQNRGGGVGGLEGGICYQAKRVMRGVQPEVSLMVVLCPGDWMSATGQQLEEEDVVNMSHAARWKKKSLFHVGGWSTSSVCVPVSKGEAEHLREKFKSTECKKHLRVISQNRGCKNQKHTKRESRNESLKYFCPAVWGLKIA